MEIYFFQRLTAWVSTSDMAKHAATESAVTMCGLRPVYSCSVHIIRLRVRVILTTNFNNRFVCSVSSF